MQAHFGIRLVMTWWSAAFATVCQLWRTGDDAAALRWVLVNVANSAVFLLAVNLLEDRQRRSGKGGGVRPRVEYHASLCRPGVGLCAHHRRPGSPDPARSAGAETLCGPYLQEVIATALCVAESNACMRRIGVEGVLWSGPVADALAGLVEVPCVKRNVIGAVDAVSAADMALAGIESRVPVDQVIDCMGDVGRRLPVELRETALGGLAATPFGQSVRERLERERRGRLDDEAE